ncbi:hypothetical protein GJV06_19245 [Enterobacteriaceae bacterium RIT691]|nr:hypothetical protein [Enterobacteriaceae bacterium RIT691]
MNKNFYRLLFSKARGMLIAVPEYATSCVNKSSRATPKRVGKQSAPSSHPPPKRSIIALSVLASLGLLTLQSSFASTVVNGTPDPDGVLTIEKGYVFNSGSGGDDFIGSTVGSNGTVNVNGTWLSSANVVRVGVSGNGSVNISDGGTFTAQNYLYLGVNAGSSGTASVDGSGSSLTADNISLGRWAGATGELDIQNGGLVTTRSIFAGYESSGAKIRILNGGQLVSDTGAVGYTTSDSSGDVTVDGEGSSWINKSVLAVGQAGIGKLTITNSGTVSVQDNLTLGGSYKKPDGSLLNGSGNLTISNNGSLSVANTLTMAYLTGSRATATVSDKGQLNANELDVGTWGTGTVNVSKGGKVAIDNILNVGMGDGGNGTINVLNGGQLVSGAAYLAHPYLGASGTVVVDGQGSTWTNQGNLDIGNDGAGKLSLSNGGYVTTGSMIVGNGGNVDIGSGSTLKARTVNLADKAVMTVNQSSLETYSGQLFNAASDGTTTDSHGFNTTGAKIAFNNSQLILDDAAYTLGYADSVNRLLFAGNNAHNTLVFIGNLSGDLGDAPNTMLLETAAQSGLMSSDTILAQVTIEAHTPTVTVGDALTPNGLGVASIRITDTSSAPAVAVTQGQKLVLTGARDGTLVSAAAPVSIRVDTGSTLQLGVAGVTNQPATTLTGSIASTGGAVVVDAGNTSISGGVNANSHSSVDIHSGATLASDVALKESAMRVAGSLNTGTLTADHDTAITVGDTGHAGILTAVNADLNGASLYIDPAWQPGVGIEGASQVALGGETINGRITTGQNALLVLGDVSTDRAKALFADSGLSWGPNGVTAAAAVLAPQTLSSNGGLWVDGSLTTDSGAIASQATFANNSLLIVDGAAASGGNAALTSSGGTLKVADQGKLYIADAKAGQRYTITRGFATSDVAANGWNWNSGNLVLNKLLNATQDNSNGTITFTTSVEKAAKALPGVVLPETLDTMVGNSLNATNSPNAGIRYLSQVLDAPQLSDKDVVRTLNSAAQIAVLGGVQSNMLSTGQAATDAVVEHNSIVNHALGEDGKTSDVWVNVLYSNQQSSDQNIGSMSYGHDTDYYGLIVGGDVTRDLSVGQLRSGGAFHAGNGDTNANGDSVATKNDFNFFGATWYENWRKADLNITGDLGYSASNNDLQQNGLKSSVDANLLTAGITGEYLFSTDVMDITPYVGVRYNQLTTDGFATKNSAGEKVFSTETERQNLWQFPVGVRLNKTFTLSSGWTISPQADLAVVPVTGDTDSTSRVSAYGVNASDVIVTPVFDSTAFDGQVGVKAQQRNITWGLNYRVAASEHMTDQGVVASFKYAF